MQTLALGTPASKRVTTLRDFFHTPTGDLFTVRPGLSADDALEQASCFLSVALDALSHAASETENMSVYGASYLLEIAKGVVDSATCAVNAEGRTATGMAEPPDPLAFLKGALEDSVRNATQAKTSKMRAYHDGRVSAFQIAIATLEG